MDPVQKLSAERVSELGPFRLLAVGPADRLADAVTVMRHEKVGCALVVSDGRCVGVITERDILFRMGTAQPMDVPVMDAVSGKVFSIKMSDSVGDAIKTMNRNQCRHLVVLEGEGTPIGVLSIKRILRELVEHMPSAVLNLPPDPFQVHVRPEGA